MTMLGFKDRGPFPDECTGNRAGKKRANLPMKGGSPKSTSAGMNLSKNATNASPIGSKTKAESPNSWPQSRNRGSGY